MCAECNDGLHHARANFFSRKCKVEKIKNNGSFGVTVQRPRCVRDIKFCEPKAPLSAPTVRATAYALCPQPFLFCISIQRSNFSFRHSCRLPRPRCRFVPYICHHTPHKKQKKHAPPRLTHYSTVPSSIHHCLLIITPPFPTYTHHKHHITSHHTTAHLFPPLFPPPPHLPSSFSSPSLSPPHITYLYPTHTHTHTHKHKPIHLPSFPISFLFLRARRHDRL